MTTLQSVMKERITELLNEPLVRAKYGKCPHCSFKTKSYIVHKNNSIAQHIKTNHPEVPDKVDKILSLFASLLHSEMEGIIGKTESEEYTSPARATMHDFKVLHGIVNTRNQLRAEQRAKLNEKVELIKSFNK